VPAALRPVVPLHHRSQRQSPRIESPFVAQKSMNYPVMVGNDRVAQLYGGIDSLEA
jgi:hypothetical protein